MSHSLGCSSAFFWRILSQGESTVDLPYRLFTSGRPSILYSRPRHGTGAEVASTVQFYPGLRALLNCHVHRQVLP